MKFLTLTLLLFALSISLNSFSQVATNTTLSDGFAPVTTLTTAGKSLFVPLKIQTKTHYLPLSYWSKKNTVGFDISEVAFVNWNAGGTSSISGLLKGKFIRDYTQINYKWSNELIFRYGMNKQDGKDLKKTDDALQFNSTFGYRKDSLTNWYHSAKFNFNTQFMNGYAYPNTSKAISKPFAPAYIFMGVGAENINNEKKRIFYISPFTFKTTFVLDQKLADQGAFGVEKATYDLDGNLLTHGEKSKMELGFLITNKYKKEVFKNIILENRLSLYSDYINRFGNIDVNCDIQVELVVNQYVKANIGAHIIYDDDIKSKREVAGIQVTEGPKTQLRQAIGVGLQYVF
ncbi:MAG TPA: DUF3078 domain-containing protein [Flavobacterium sp.]|jgi:hypothetical protein|uniref:DUF3078 domain-containing protein n=1 Tax=Flavobacterium sp. TaxID=239 RepID=UPI001B40F03B|nr:DUF3078 domain-containing protein [Flavobacterium sp.]MBP6146530.1 DUF3078 domain-containing protein [Flavobacterium sp.]MBP7182490.1 DUF3078 domain-containing protein [Flavobacterium sp.]MBP7317331.1 DUF3078 domain-containing protein [Flavobacterium sp.]MBP8885964.1 DUF3078 domain-containing protein [Flavobacterium sp.]HRL72031.1 DUF3078 domain-containing protein [Flavobacterium sp.]